MTKTRTDSVHIECTYIELPRYYMKLRRSGFNSDDIIKRRTSATTYTLTATRHTAI